MIEAYMIIDLQYGSTGKGLLAGYLAEMYHPDVVVTAWGPNAGHTYINHQGRTFIHRMLANGVVSPGLEHVLIGPGSVLDIDCLMREIVDCSDLLIGKKIIIHPQAVVVTQEHRDIEKRNVKIGSTMKGTGAAVIARIERDPDADPTAISAIPIEWLDTIAEMGIAVSIDAEAYALAIVNARIIQIEGAQGFSLSMYHGFYPYTTSRDVTPAQVMADCAIPFSIIPEVYGTMRTFPIRVANRYDEKGNMIGTSGPYYPDQMEINWEDIGLEPELTTVTKLPRRIFTFSKMQTVDAIYQCHPKKIFLNFVNYLSVEETEKIINIINKAGGRIEWIGTGPTVKDVCGITHWRYLNDKILGGGAK